MQNDTITVLGSSEPVVLLAVGAGAFALIALAVYLTVKTIDTRPDVAALIAFACLAAGVVGLITPLPGINPAAAIIGGLLMMFAAAFSHNRRMQA